MPTFLTEDRLGEQDGKGGRLGQSETSRAAAPTSRFAVTMCRCRFVDLIPCGVTVEIPNPSLPNVGIAM